MTKEPKLTEEEMNELDTLNTGGDYDLYESAPLQIKASAIPNTIKAPKGFVPARLRPNSN